MSIIISKDGKNARKLDTTSIAEEAYLQQYISDNPNSLPLDEIAEDIRLLILAREFPTGSGPIDALGVDLDGNIYVIETKLYKNPDKRKVLAQVLDYGASLWRTYEDRSLFAAELERAVSKTFGVSLTEKIQTFYDTDSDTAAAVIQNAQQNLGNGNFRFVVLMDQLEDRLKNLITFVNQNSRFTVYGVELEFYKFEAYEILIPKLYGSEVKKEVSPTKAATSNSRWDEHSFFEAADALPDTQIVRAIHGLYEFSKENARVTWGGRVVGTFNARFDRISPRALYSVYSDGNLWLNFKDLSDNDAAVVAERCADRLRQLPGFNIPQEASQRYVKVKAETWAPQVENFIDIMRELIR
jgi:hypothetical protein